MNRHYKKVVSTLLMVFMVLSIIPFPADNAAAGPVTSLTSDIISAAEAVYGTIEEYSLNYTAMHATKDQASSMNSYFIKPGKLTVRQGKKLVSFTVKDSTTVPSLKVEQNGVMTETTVISTDATANTRVVEFEVGDLTALLNAQVHVSTTIPGGGAYEMDHSIRLKFDVGNKPALNTSIADAQSTHNAAVEGIANGQYPAGAKDTLQAAIDQANATAGNIAASQQQVDQAVVALQAALTAFKASIITVAPGSGAGSDPLQDGVYPIGYTIYKKGTSEKSVMYDYVDPSSGKLTVQGGKKFVSFTLKQSAQIKSFKTQKDGILVETATVSSDSVPNTRVVQFEVDDLKARLNGWVKIYWELPPPIGIYDHEYEVELGFSDLPTAPPANTVSKTALNQAIESAQAAYDAAVEGTANGQYPVGAKGTLQTAIDRAKATADNAETTQEQVDQAAAALQTALSAFNASLINHADTEALPDGVYKLAYTIYKKGTNEKSVMYDYVDPASGQLTVQGGKKLVSFTMKQSAEIKSFQTMVNGTLVETATVSSDNATNTRVVQFEVDDLTARLNGWVKIYWEQPLPIGIYDHEYDVELGFGDITVDLTKPVGDGNYSFSFTATSDDSSGTPISSYLENVGGLKVQDGKKVASLKLKSGVTVTKIQMIKGDTIKDIMPQYAAKQSGQVRILANYEGLVDVQFEVEDFLASYLIQLSAGQGDSAQKRTFKLSFDKAVPLSSDSTTPVTPGNPGGGTTGGSTGGSTGGTTGGGGGGVISNPSALADGKYTMNYTIVKYGTSERSVMQDYVISPGVLTVEGGKQYLAITLKQSKEITEFQTEKSGSLIDTEVIGRNEEKNTRDARFEVPDLSSKLKGWVKVDWPEYNYFHSYDVEITFDKLSARKVSSTEGLSGGGSAVASLKNGEYDLDFQILQHRSNLESKVTDYIVRPGKLIIKDDKKYVQLTLNRNKEITDFKVEREKASENTGNTNNMNNTNTAAEKVMESATVVSTAEAENLRTVKFEVKDLTATQHALVTMIPEESSVEAEQTEVETVDTTTATNDDGESDSTLPALQKTEDIDFDIVFNTEAFEKKDTKQEETPADSAAQEVPSAPAQSINDIQDHWAKTLIERALALGIVNGYEDGTFRPDGEISRAEFTAMIGRTLKLQGTEADLSFADADSIPLWVKPMVAQAVGAGIITSYEDQTFRAGRKITRSEIAVMVARALGLPQDENAALSFADADQIPEWAYPYVAAAFQSGMVSGRDNNLFAPNARATRAEAVTLVMALLNNEKQ